MIKKIVVEPCFNEFHFIKLHIGNVCDYFKPDIYVIAEGMFPAGPEVLDSSANNIAIENRKTIIKNYTLNGEGKRSFDFNELKEVVQEYQKKYPQIKFFLLEMDYPAETSVTKAFELAYNSFKQVTNPQPDDLIFPLECDVFFTQQQVEEILKKTEKLEQNRGITCSYKQYFVSPRVNWIASKQNSRRIVYRYGAGELWGNYDGVAGTAKMFWRDYFLSLDLFHYIWVRPDKYWDLRKQQIVRMGGHHKRIEKAREIIKIARHNVTDVVKRNLQVAYPGGRFHYNELTKEDHPIHFRNHESFKYYYE